MRAHCRAFNVPAWPTFAIIRSTKWRIPIRLVGFGKVFNTLQWPKVPKEGLHLSLVLTVNRWEPFAISIIIFIPLQYPVSPLSSSPSLLPFPIILCCNHSNPFIFPILPSHHSYKQPAYYVQQPVYLDQNGQPVYYRVGTLSHTQFDPPQTP